MRNLTRMTTLRAPDRLPDALARGPVVVLALGAEAALAGRCLGRTVVYSEHSKGGVSRETSASYPSSPWARLIVDRMRRAEREAVASASVVVFPSQGAVELFRDWHPECSEALSRAKVIYNGIPDLGAGEADTSSPRLLLNIAAHVPEKQVELFVQAAGLFLSEAGSGYEAVNYGDPVDGWITARLRGTAAAACVQLGGFVSRASLVAALRRCWVFVTCPSCAVFDLGLLEAMAAGRPVVAAPVGGNVEALGDDYPFYASTERDIRDRLLQLRDTPGLWAALSARNRSRYLSRFTVSAMAEGYGAILSQLVGPAPSIPRPQPPFGAHA